MSSGFAVGARPALLLLITQGIVARGLDVFGPSRGVGWWLLKCRIWHRAEASFGVAGM